jgi:hypothetical protein
MDNIVKMMEDRKDRITEELSRQYSLNTISLEEYERLIEYTHKAETEKELIIIEKIIKENNAVPGYKNTGGETIDKAPARDDYTILSSRKISGPRLNEIKGKIITILGDSHITLNDDNLIEDETFIDVVVVLGETVLHVPKNVAVLNRVVPIMGGIFGNEEGGNGGQSKKLILRGTVILGNVTIQQKT